MWSWHSILVLLFWVFFFFVILEINPREHWSNVVVCTTFLIVGCWELVCTRFSWTLYDHLIVFLIEISNFFMLLQNFNDRNSFRKLRFYCRWRINIFVILCWSLMKYIFLWKKKKWISCRKRLDVSIVGRYVV